MHDIGTGTYTVMQQVAADALGLAPEKVTVRLGDTRLPESHASIGSATMANAGASVMLAANAACDKATGAGADRSGGPFRRCSSGGRAHRRRQAGAGGEKT